MNPRTSALRAQLPPDLAPLEELALDLRWTWSHAGDALWRAIDNETWERTENPYVILQSLGEERLRELDGNAAFKRQLQTLVASRKEYQTRPGPWATPAGAISGGQIAYFSLEFGLAEALPLYAGGLGVLAGDFLKGASDLGIPLIGIGLLYQEGYFRQVLDDDGLQHAVYPFNDPDGLPISRVFDRRGAWLSVAVEFPGRTVRFRVWQACVGRVVLYLLDSNDPWNSASDRGIVGKLYGGGAEMRLMQEIALGIAGWRLIEALDLDVRVCHLNEGHAAFAALERARCFAERNRIGFWDAVWATRAGNVFTTHTAVAAAFDHFSQEMLAKYGREYAAGLGVPVAQIAALGQPPGGASDSFNMAYLAARLCASINGVSRLHGEASRRVFAELYPRWPLAQVPVTHVTNGVHFPSWDSAWSDTLWTGACGKQRWLGLPDALGAGVATMTDEALWSLRGAQRKALVSYARRRLSRQFAQRANGVDAPVDVNGLLDSNVLTLGFARRFTEYKRPNLLLRDTARLARLLTDARRPVQLIVAGKAHPADDVGKRLLQQWVQLASMPALRGRIVFLEDYDIALAQEMVQGVDVWINTPRRPWEACGTSGMKVLVNGGLNISVLDGWWAEAFDPAVGWAVPEPQAGMEEVDAAQARQLFAVLEEQVVPLFYERNAQGIAAGWIARMRSSMSLLAPQFSTNRMLRDYLFNLYMPAAKLHESRTASGGRAGTQLRQWARVLRRNWAQLHLGAVTVTQHDALVRFSLAVYLGEILPDMVDVQLFADAAPPRNAVFCESMHRVEPVPGSANGYVYTLDVPVPCAAEEFTPRVVPRHELARIPIELGLIAWGSR